MNIQTDARKITQEELDHIHRMTKIARIGRISAQARAAKMRKQVRTLRKALTAAGERIAALSPDGYIAPERWTISAALEATKKV